MKKFSLLDRLCIIKSIIKQRGFFKLRFNIVRETIKRFYFKKRYKLYLSGFLSLIASLFEYLGLILIYQFAIMLSNPDCKSSIYLTNLFEKYFNTINFSSISLFIGILIALIYIFKNIYMYFFTKINSSILQDLSTEIAIKIIKDILYGDFVKISNLSNDKKQGIISKVDIVVWQYFMQFINLISNIAIILMLIAFLFVKFTIPAIFSFIFISILSLIEYAILKNKSNYQNKYFGFHFDNLTKIIHTIINSSKEIRINNKSKYFLNQAEEKYKNLAIMNKKANADGVFHIYFTEISIMITFIVVLIALFMLTGFDNTKVIATLGTIIAVILRITPCINRAQSAIYGINSNEKIAIDLIEFDKQFENILNIYETDEKLPFKKEIKLENISFDYGGSGLENINLTVKKGEFIGIVGHSGSYKTTLSLIIAGLIKAKGNMYIDNVLLENENFKKWQNNISILSQDFNIIKDNIFDGLNEDLINKLELADFNQSPMKLSFGQKQRVALAQIIAQNKEILILDEATSAMDVLSEDKINDMLLKLKGNKTIISIAHRLQILKHCDRIIYMDKGKIIDIDTLSNLNEKHEDFRQIIELSNFKL